MRDSLLKKYIYLFLAEGHREEKIEKIKKRFSSDASRETILILSELCNESNLDKFLAWILLQYKKSNILLSYLSENGVIIDASFRKYYSYHVGPPLKEYLDFFYDINKTKYSISEFSNFTKYRFDDFITQSLNSYFGQESLSYFSALLSNFEYEAKSILNLYENAIIACGSHAQDKSLVHLVIQILSDHKIIGDYVYNLISTTSDFRDFIDIIDGNRNELYRVYLEWKKSDDPRLDMISFIEDNYNYSEINKSGYIESLFHNLKDEKDYIFYKETENFMIYRIFTVESTCELGKNSGWCFSKRKISGGPTQSAIDHFNEDYLSDPEHKLYFIYNKANPLKKYMLNIRINEPIDFDKKIKNIIDDIIDMAEKYYWYRESSKVLFNGVLNSCEFEVDIAFKDISNNSAFIPDEILDIFPVIEKIINFWGLKNNLTIDKNKSEPAKYIYEKVKHVLDGE
jgi:hypothetical protein